MRGQAGGRRRLGWRAPRMPRGHRRARAAAVAPPPPFGNRARVVVVGRGSGIGADGEEAGHWWAQFGVGGVGGGLCQTVRRHSAVWRAVARDTVCPPCGVLGVNARWRGRLARQLDGHLVPDGRGRGQERQHRQPENDSQCLTDRQSNGQSMGEHWWTKRLSSISESGLLFWRRTQVKQTIRTKP